MQCASSITSRPERAATVGRTSARNAGLLNRSGETRSRSTSSRSIAEVISSQSSRFSLLIVKARTPARSAIRIWLRISARSGETRIVGPAPASRSSRVAMKYTADLPHPVRWTRRTRRRSATTASIASRWPGRKVASGPAMACSSSRGRSVTPKTLPTRTDRPGKRIHPGLRQRAARNLRVGRWAQGPELQSHHPCRLPVSLGNAAGASSAASGRRGPDAGAARSGSIAPPRSRA